jgi:hypothetical protein
LNEGFNHRTNSSCGLIGKYIYFYSIWDISYTCGSGPLLYMAGYSSLWVGYKLFLQAMDLNVKVEYIEYI